MKMIHWFAAGLLASSVASIANAAPAVGQPAPAYTAIFVSSSDWYELPSHVETVAVPVAFAVHAYHRSKGIARWPGAPQAGSDWPSAPVVASVVS
mgnify:CR=1 FL=1